MGGGRVDRPRPGGTRSFRALPLPRRFAFGLGLAATLAGAWVVGAWLAPPAALATSAPGGPSVSAQDQGFAGAREGCRRCHLREYRSWEKTPHANALATLESEGEAANPECLTCHSTGFGQPTGFISADATPELAGVTCESCHGAGADYRDRDVMKSREASLAAGLHVPNEATCRGCHNENSPTFPGTFDFEAMREGGVHEVKR